MDVQNLARRQHIRLILRHQLDNVAARLDAAEREEPGFVRHLRVDDPPVARVAQPYGGIRELTVGRRERVALNRRQSLVARDRQQLRGAARRTSWTGGSRGSDRRLRRKRKRRRNEQQGSYEAHSSHSFLQSIGARVGGL